MTDLFERIEDIEEQRKAHNKSYRTITGEQNFVDRMISAAALDTGIGQLAQSLKYRFELDVPYRPEPADQNYNPISDPQIEGYENFVDEFIGSSSPGETAVRIRMLNRNLERRRDLENHGFARFMGNVIDPINLIPIPLSRGIGLVRGFQVGAAGTALPFAISETARARMDPTNDPLEPVIAIGGGALLGGSIGGLVGSIRPKTLELTAGGWLGSNNATDALNKLNDMDEGVVAGLRPFVKKTANQSNEDHLKEFVGPTIRETTQEYEERIARIAKDDELYADYVTAAQGWDPDMLLPTGTAFERLRLKEAPYLLLKNNRFEGALGNALRKVADRIAGPPGLVTSGAAIGVKQAQGVYNKAHLHNIHATEFNTAFYAAYLRSMGKNFDELTPGQAVVESLKDLKPSRARSFNEFKHDVVEHYLTRTLSDDRAVLDGAEALLKYTERMEKAGMEAGVLGVHRLLNQVRNLEQGIQRQDEFIDLYLRGDPDSLNDSFRIGVIGRLEQDQRTLRDLNEAANRQGSLTEKQYEYQQTLIERIERNQQQVAEINAWQNVSNREEFLATAGEREFVNESVKKAVDRTLQARELRARAQAMREQEANIGEKVDPDALGFYPRQWNYEAIRQNRDEFIEILEKHYLADGGQLERASGTIAKMLKEMDAFRIKEFVRTELQRLDVEPAQIAALEAKIDKIARRKRSGKQTKKDLILEQQRDMRVLLDDYMKTYGFGDEVNKLIAETMSEIDAISANGNMLFGAASSTFQRSLNLPSHLFIQKRDGTGAKVDFLETDPDRLVRRYHRRMAASIEMANEFGDPTMRAYMDEIEDAINLDVSRAKTPEEGAKLLEEGQRMIQAMDDLSQKVLGVYRIPADPSSLSNRTIRVVKNLMVMNLMGKAAVAALADTGRVVMSVGLKNTFEGLWNRWGAASQEFVRGGREVTEAGEAAEIALHGRFEAIFDIDGYIFEATPFERMIEGGVNKMFILNGLAPWTDMMKRFSGAMIQSEMIRMAVKWAGDSDFVEEAGEQVLRGKSGKLNQDEIFMLTKNGIGFEEAIQIARQWKKHGSKGDKLHLANAGEWDDPVAQKLFRTALVQEVNNAIITPSAAEKLNFMSTPVGSLLTQFKSFAFSATQRTLMAGLQQRDAKAFHGLLSMVAMGYMVDVIKSPSYDKRDFTSLDRLVQALDYSGATGILFDMNNMLEVMSGNNAGIRPLLGVDSFFKDPNFAQRSGQIGGPAASLGFDLIHSLFDPDTSGSDWARSVRRLLPFNNLIWWSWAVDRLQRSTGEYLDNDEDE